MDRGSVLISAGTLLDTANCLGRLKSQPVFRDIDLLAMGSPIASGCSN